MRYDLALSIPRGPNDVRTASATARAAKMFPERTAVGFSLSLKTPLLKLPCIPSAAAIFTATLESVPYVSPSQ